MLFIDNTKIINEKTLILRIIWMVRLYLKSALGICSVAQKKCSWKNGICSVESKKELVENRYLFDSQKGALEDWYLFGSQIKCSWNWYLFSSKIKCSWRIGYLFGSQKGAPEKFQKKVFSKIVSRWRTTASNKNKAVKCFASERKTPAYRCYTHSCKTFLNKC